MTSALAGLKYRRGLALLGWDQAPFDVWAGAVRRLALERINLVLAHQVPGRGGCLCLEAHELARALELVAEAPGPYPRVVSPVSLLVAYPRSGGVRVPAACLAALARAGCPPLTLGCSLSAVALVVDQARLDEALTALTQALPLAAGRSPGEERIRVQQAPLMKEPD